MHILIVDATSQDRAITAAHLTFAQHQVTHAVDVSSAIKQIALGSIDVVVVDSRIPGRAMELVRLIRAQESTTHIYVIMVAATVSPGDLRDAFDGGVDDFLRKPVSREELLARVDGLTRIRHWASRVFAGAPSIVDKSTAALAAFRMLQASVTAEIAEMLDCVLEPIDSPEGVRGATYIAQIALSLPAEHCEIAIAMGADVESLCAAGQVLLGTDDLSASSARDVLREMANTAAGAFKRLAASEGAVFTLGIPTDIDEGAVREAAVEHRLMWRVVSPSGLKLSFEAEIRARGSRQVTVAALREGMVLASDLVSARGLVLLRTGTRLTRSVIERLPNVVNEKSLVAISAAA